MNIKDFTLRPEADFFKRKDFTLLIGANNGLLMTFDNQGELLTSIIISNRVYPHDKISFASIYKQLAKITNISINTLLRDNDLKLYIKKASDLYPQLKKVS